MAGHVKAPRSKASVRRLLQVQIQSQRASGRRLHMSGVWLRGLRSTVLGLTANYAGPPTSRLSHSRSKFPPARFLKVHNQLSRKTSRRREEKSVGQTPAHFDMCLSGSACSTRSMGMSSPKHDQEALSEPERRLLELESRWHIPEFKETMETTYRTRY
eukprot:SAG31_NODE_3573_length_4113_cov_4.139013_2_plen_158_part_00